MKRKGVLIILIFSITFTSLAQISSQEISALKRELQSAKDDSVRLNILFNLSTGYRFSNTDSSLFYADQVIDLADQLNHPYFKAQMLSLKGATVLEIGKLPESLELQFEAIRIGEELKDSTTVAIALNRIGNIYMELGDYEKAIEYYWKSENYYRQMNIIGMVHNEVSNIGNVYELMGIPDSALYYQLIAYEGSLISPDRNQYTRSELMFRMGNAYKLNGNYEKALEFYKKGISEAKIDNDLRNHSMNNLFISKLFFEKNMKDSSIYYALKSIQTAKEISFRKGILEASLLMSEIFKREGDYENALEYLSMANIERDSLTGTKRIQELQRIILSEQERQRTENAEKIAQQNKRRQEGLLAGSLILLFIAFILYRNNRQKQKANAILESTLWNLKSTQAQLIQSEKMASLGELTAGIAHEIQNPLNFVNNFSELNQELIDELTTEIEKGNFEEVKEISISLKENEAKINQHGKRADFIVKGMLQHSRTSTGEKELTNLNILADEFLRLSYHGIRARDKSFNADFVLNLDPDLPRVKVVSQDIGRVLLNLFNNAFYACSHHSKDDSEASGPKVIVSTKNLGDQIRITVSDNGSGIPDGIKEKIFQPFFTTKPTGQGTGLGLSISYDIIKAHGGELTVESKVGVGTEFRIHLPIVGN